MGTATRAYNYSVDRLNGVATPSISSRLKPKLTMALWLLSLSLTVFSYNPSMIACRDNYTGRVRDGMMVLVPAGLYLLIANAITDLVDEIVLVGVGSWGSEEQKLIVQLHNQLQHFKREVVASSDSEFNEFKKILPSIEKFCELQV
jgi:hypothetical protein